ncbi:MAG TPA: M20/M25/M40 family metallo-hydrolase [Segetibacter sp.]|jgi:glutamate carboxypeptidase
MRIISLLLLLLSFFQSSAQKLSAEETKIIELINKQLPQNLQLLEDMVNINSGTLNTAGVKLVGELLGKQFQNIGFSTEWVTLPDSLKRAGHLVAYKKGTKGKKLFLIGHLDTVFEPDMPANPYRKLNDSTATGQGANDMKGGNVVILAALQALNQLGLLKNASITAYFTGDEENAGKPNSVSRADFISRAKQAEIALGFEGAQGLRTVATGRRGSSGWQLKVQGRQAHSAGVFNNNYGAIYEAARIINSFREQLGNEKYLTFNPGIFAGGSDVTNDSAKYVVQGKTNIISPYTFVNGDLRFLTEKQKETARQKMKTIATTNNLPGTKAEITFSDGIPGMEPTEGNNKLVEVLNKVSMDMGIGETKAGDPGGRGAGDISYVAQYVDCIDGLGASGSGAHAPGETINLKQFPILIQRAAIYIYRLTR